MRSLEMPTAADSRRAFLRRAGLAVAAGASFPCWSPPRDRCSPPRTTLTSCSGRAGSPRPSAAIDVFCARIRRTRTPTPRSDTPPCCPTASATRRSTCPRLSP
ncbi:twin-arginine translocation signal domain-containing protein [Actinomadura madurae]|uniref:twin-arginine translocation signal domain-containing protein n=1 Tax=Actinomadura madurae TaxID=1993 RepID=UPI0009F89602